MQQRLEIIFDKYKFRELGFKYKTTAWYHLWAPAFVLEPLFKNKSIYLDAVVFEGISDNGLAYVVFHEIGHLYTPDGGQTEADCWAAKKMKHFNIPIILGVKDASSAMRQKMGREKRFSLGWFLSDIFWPEVVNHNTINSLKYNCKEFIDNPD